MTPESGLLAIRKLAKSHGWSFYRVYESLPPRYLTDNFLIRLARNDADATLLIKNHMQGLFFNKAARCK